MHDDDPSTARPGLVIAVDSDNTGAVRAVPADAHAARVPRALISRVAQERERDRLPTPGRPSPLDSHDTAVMLRGADPENLTRWPARGVKSARRRLTRMRTSTSTAALSTGGEVFALTL
jgi:hypothetical protein